MNNFMGKRLNIIVFRHRKNYNPVFRVILGSFNYFSILSMHIFNLTFFWKFVYNCLYFIVKWWCPLQNHFFIWFVSILCIILICIILRFNAIEILRITIIRIIIPIIVIIVSSPPLIICIVMIWCYNNFWKFYRVVRIEINVIVPIVAPIVAPVIIPVVVILIPTGRARNISSKQEQKDCQRNCLSSIHDRWQLLPSSVSRFYSIHLQHKFPCLKLRERSVWLYLAVHDERLNPLWPVQTQNW